LGSRIILILVASSDAYTHGELILSANSSNGTFASISIVNFNNDHNIDHVRSAIAGDLDILCSTKAGWEGVIMYKNLSNQNLDNSLFFRGFGKKKSINIDDIDNDINQNGERNQNEFGLNRQLTIQPGNIIINSDTTGFGLWIHCLLELIL
jgi:hypothetical protein